MCIYLEDHWEVCWQKKIMQNQPDGNPCLKRNVVRALLVAQWQRIHLPRQEIVGSVPDPGRSHATGATEHLNLCTTTAEPLLESPGTAGTEPPPYWSLHILTEAWTP